MFLSINVENSLKAVPGKGFRLFYVYVGTAWFQHSIITYLSRTIPF